MNKESANDSILRLAKDYAVDNGISLSDNLKLVTCLDFYVIYSDETPVMKATWNPGNPPYLHDFKMIES